MSRRPGSSRHGRQASVDIPKYAPQSQIAQAQPLQASLVSDYESDNQGYISDYPVHHPPAPRTDAELNLSVLRRHNPDIVAILSVAAYAVIYEFTPIPEPTWSKTGVEGTMFICQQAPGLFGEDRYNIIILNRRGLQNFDVELREAEDGGVEISDPYVIISCKQGMQQKIYGVFIFSEGEGTSTEQARLANAELMKKLAEAAGYSRRAAESAAAEIAQQHNQSHVQEAGSIVPQNGQHINLEQFFGQQRREDADYSLHAHNYQQPSHYNYAQQHSHNQYQQDGGSPAPPNVLNDLFRNAGLT